MLFKCLECNYKYGNIACLKYHYESCHTDKTDKCVCGNIILSGICEKKQHPDVELTRGFSRNLTERSAELVTRSVELVPRSVVTQTGESCWRNKTEGSLCKYYNFVSFLINNGLNIEK